MPTDKRERQRAGREARRAEARAAQRRAQRRRQIMSIGGLLAVVIAIGVFINLSGGGSDSEDASATTTTTAKKALAVGTTDCPPAEGAAERKVTFDGPPKDCLTDGATYAATIETDVGTFTFDLDREQAPKTVNNFVFLARYKAYDGIPFHRVIPGFVVQGGDVSKISEEKPKAGQYEVGSVAMAKSQVPDSTGSQFFVITGDQGVQLPPDYSLFGKVTEGMDVVKKIEADGSAAGTPKVVHKIVKVTITEKKG
jgi:cyclophilin family peptidyl-prolyl cis-trans isomerase